MELDVLSIIVNLGGRNNCFILHMSPKYPKTCPTEVSHVPAVTQLEHCPWVSVHQVPSAGFPFPLKCVACSHKPKGKKQNGLLKPRLSFLLLEEKNTTAEFVNSATTSRETFHKTGFVCESVRQKGTGRITAEAPTPPALQVNPASTRKATRTGTQLLQLPFSSTKLLNASQKRRNVRNP